MTEFALCLTCPEITTGRMDSSKGWLLDASSNHHNCDVKPFRNPATLPPPIRNAILRLGAGIGVRDTDITMLKLGLQMEDAWTPHQSTARVVASISPPSRAAARVSAVSTKSRPASAPTSITSVKPVDGQLELFTEAS